MIESLAAFVTNPGYPNPHVIIVHFPIAFICVAPLLDLSCLIFGKHMWLDRAATLLYLLGTIGAGAAYLSGQRTAGALVDLTPAAESAIADHESFALLTLIALAVVAVARLMVTWLSRNDRRIRIGFFRLVAIPIALVGLVLVALTADRGGHLVYGHGLGVDVQSTIKSSD